MVVLDGETDLLKVPLPVPVVEPPELLRVKVHAPDAVTVPVTLVLVPLQTVTGELVILADRYTETVGVPDRETGVQPFASVTDTRL